MPGKHANFAMMTAQSLSSHFPARNILLSMLRGHFPSGQAFSLHCFSCPSCYQCSCCCCSCLCLCCCAVWVNKFLARVCDTVDTFHTLTPADPKATPATGQFAQLQHLRAASALRCRWTHALEQLVPLPVATPGPTAPQHGSSMFHCCCLLFMSTINQKFYLVCVRPKTLFGHTPSSSFCLSPKMARDITCVKAWHHLQPQQFLPPPTCYPDRGSCHHCVRVDAAAVAIIMSNILLDAVARLQPELPQSLAMHSALNHVAKLFANMLRIRLPDANTNRRGRQTFFSLISICIWSFFCMKIISVQL